MDTPASDRFAVIEDVYQLQNWQLEAELLTEVLGMPPVGARQQARKSHGFLAVNLPAEPAGRLREACAGRGIVVHVVPQSDVIPAIKPMRMHQVWLADDALWVRATDLDAKTPLAWDALRLIAVTKTTKQESFHHWQTTSRNREVKLKVTTYNEDFTEFLADLFAVSSQGEVFAARLVSRELNYAQALGDLARDAAADANLQSGGFRLLLSTIAARAPRAHVPPESQALLNKPLKGSLRAPLVPLDEFDAHNRWLLQRLRLTDQ